MEIPTYIVLIVLAVLILGAITLIRRWPKPRRAIPLTPQQVQLRMVLYAAIGFGIFLALQYLLRALGH